MYGNSQVAGAGQAIFTHDVSLQVFMEHLKRLVRVSVFIYLDAVCLCVVFFCQGAVGAQTNYIATCRRFMHTTLACWFGCGILFGSTIVNDDFLSTRSFSLSTTIST
jgi:hypothetical protein